MMEWHDLKQVPPASGVSVLLKLRDGSVHEGHFIKNANKYVKDVNRFRVYKLGNKTLEMDQIDKWAELPNGKDEKIMAEILAEMESRMYSLKRTSRMLLAKYREEKEKQVVAMRLSARSGSERDKARMLKAKLDKEIRTYEQSIDDA